MATILSTPPPQPTTNVNDTPLPTTQEPQQRTAPKNKRKSLSTSVPTDANQNNSDKTCNEDNVYSHPEVILDNVELQTKPNEACATTISTETNVAYYSTNMVIEEKEAYITNIITETNKAYAPRNIVTVTTENRYIYENEPEDEYY